MGASRAGSLAASIIYTAAASVYVTSDRQAAAGRAIGGKVRHARTHARFMQHAAAALTAGSSAHQLSLYQISPIKAYHCQKKGSVSHTTTRDPLNRRICTSRNIPLNPFSRPGAMLGAAAWRLVPRRNEGRAAPSAQCSRLVTARRSALKI